MDHRLLYLDSVEKGFPENATALTLAMQKQCRPGYALCPLVTG